MNFPIKAIGPNGKLPDSYSSDYLDYRGIATGRECQQLRRGVVSLGRRLQPQDGALAEELFLTHELLKRHVAVIGPTGAGKTAGIVEPWAKSLVEAGCSVAVIDIIGNLYEPLAARARACGHRCWYWDSNSQHLSQSWNWLDEFHLWEEEKMEGAIASILGKPPQDEKLNWHYGLDATWLRVAISIVKIIYGSQATPQLLHKLVANQQNLIAAFDNYPAIADRYADEMQLLLHLSPVEYLKAVQGILRELAPFRKNNVTEVTQRSDFHLDDFDSEPTLLIIGDCSLTDPTSATKLAGIMLGFLSQLVYRRLRQCKDRRTPLYLAIDEAPRHQHKIDFPQIFAVARNADVGLLLATQDISEFKDRGQIASIFNNCNTIIATDGVPPESADYLSELLGHRRVQDTSVSQPHSALFKDLDKSFWQELFGIGRERNVTVRRVEVPVLGKREIRFPPVGKYPALVLVSPVLSKPILVDLDLDGRTIFRQKGDR